MGSIIEFPSFQENDPDISELNKEELLECLAALRAQIEALDEEEPLDMESEEYEEWGEQHEELEDLVDEILERLDELN